MDNSNIEKYINTHGIRQQDLKSITDCVITKQKTCLQFTMYEYIEMPHVVATITFWHKINSTD